MFQKELLVAEPDVHLTKLFLMFFSVFVGMRNSTFDNKFKWRQ